MADSDGTSCNVCFEPYDLDSKLPRILPCSHSSCESCLQRLVRTNGRRRADTLICPECRKKHITRSGTRAFPYNRYIIGHLKTKKEAETNKSEKCVDHQRDISLHCLSCMKSICSICLLTIHRSHNVVDLLQMEKRSLLDLTNAVLTSVDHSLAGNLASKNCMDQKYMRNVELLRKVKEEYSQMLDALIDEALEQKKDFDIKIDRNVETLRAHARILSDIQKTCDLKTNGEVKTLMTKVKEIDSDQQDARQAINYKYYEYNVNRADPEELKNIRGRLVEGDTSTGMTGQSESLNLRIDEAREFKLLSDGNIAVSVVQYEAYNYLAKLVKYDFQGNELCSTEWGRWSIGDMEEVFFAGKACLGISYFIDGLAFYDMETLEEVFYYRASGVYQPLCSTAPSTLLYVTKPYSSDIPWYQIPYDVKSLNCSASPPKCSTVFQLKHGARQILCATAGDGRHLLLVCTGRYGQVYAYDATTFQVQWKLDVKYNRFGDEFVGPFRAEKLALDGRGRLFVLDTNHNCVLLCSLDGKLERLVLRGLEKGMGKLRGIGWSCKTNSLVVCHRCGDKQFLTSVSVDR